MKKRILRRLLILTVMCPPFVALTKINDDVKPEAALHRVAQRIVIHGSPSYLGPNPSL